MRFCLIQRREGSMIRCVSVFMYANEWTIRVDMCMSNGRNG